MKSMLAEESSVLSKELERGQYAPALPSDLRSPCPMINSLANHGYLNRDGRNVVSADIKDGLNQVGLSSALSYLFRSPIYLERKKATLPNDTKPEAAQPERSSLAKLWYYIRKPWALLTPQLGLRNPGQVNSKGTECMDLDQISAHGVIEHDISLTRNDFGQGDNHTRQLHLIEEMLASSSDGGKTLTMQDLANFRKHRIEQQKALHPDYTFSKLDHGVACGEISLILGVLGDGKSVRCDYVRAFFAEERLPLEEGWTPKKWWTFGVIALVTATEKVKKLVGPKP